jgi:hypothetical protein
MGLASETPLLLVDGGSRHKRHLPHFIRRPYTPEFTRGFQHQRFISATASSWIPHVA